MGFWGVFWFPVEKDFCISKGGVRRLCWHDDNLKCHLYGHVFGGKLSAVGGYGGGKACSVFWGE